MAGGVGDLGGGEFASGDGFEVRDFRRGYEGGDVDYERGEGENVCGVKMRWAARCVYVGGGGGGEEDEEGEGEDIV